MQHVLAVLDEAIAIQGAVSGKIRLTPTGETSLDLFATRGLSAAFTSRFARLGRGDATPSIYAWLNRRRVFVPDVANDPRAALYAEACRDEGFVAMQSTPIFGASGNVLGTLSTQFGAAPDWSTAQSVVLDYCATKLARVLDERFNRR